MSPGPCVSVLVPCFRSASFVRRALDSVLAQTFAGWEVVAVDNASDDGTFELLQGYARRDPRVRVFRNAENIGPVRNWRRCVELARGEYAGLLFSDDWYEPAFIGAALAQLAEAPSVGLVYSSVRIVREPTAPGGAGSTLEYQLARGGQHDSAEFLKATYEGSSAVPVSPSCALVRRADLERWLKVELPMAEELGALRHGAGPDVAVFVQACTEYRHFGHVRQPLVSFLAHAGNLTWQRQVRAAYAAALYELYERHPFEGLDPERIRARLVWKLRASGQGRRVARQLGTRGWFHLGALAAGAVGRRLVAAVGLESHG